MAKPGSKLTTIPVRVETRERLRRYGMKGETWDELIGRLLEESMPRQPADLKELKRRREEDEYIPLEEALAELGL